MRAHVWWEQNCAEFFGVLGRLLVFTRMNIKVMVCACSHSLFAWGTSRVHRVSVQVGFVLKSEWSDVRQRPFRFAKTPKCLGCLVYSLNIGKRCVHFYVYVKRIGSGIFFLLCVYLGCWKRTRFMKESAFR